MATKKEYSRLIQKQSTTPGEFPTVPGTASGEYLDSTWIDTDIHKGEFFINLEDDKVYFRSNNGIFELTTGTSATGSIVKNLQNTMDLGSTAYITDEVIISTNNDITLVSDGMYLNTGTNSTYSGTVSNSVIIGGDNLTATESNTVYVENLNVAGNFNLGGTFSGLGLPSVLSEDNSTGANDIEMGSGTSLKSSNGGSFISLDYLNNADRLYMGQTGSYLDLNNGNSGLVGTHTTSLRVNGSNQLSINSSTATLITSTFRLSGNLDIGGSVEKNTNFVSGSYSVSSSDNIIFCNTSSGAVDVTLPTPSRGREIVIKDWSGSSSTNNITIDTPLAGQIDGSATLTLNTNYESVTLVSDGNNWSII